MIQISEEINSQSWLLDNEEVSNAFNALKSKVETKVCNEIENAVAGSDFKVQYANLSEYVRNQSWLLDSEEVSNAFNALKLRVKAEVIQPILDKVDKYTEKSEYGKAIGLLYQNMKYDVDNILSNKMAVVKQQRISD